MRITNFLFIALAAAIQPILSDGQSSKTSKNALPAGFAGYGSNNNKTIPVTPAVKATVNQWMQNSGEVRFLENKGQMTDLEGKPVKELLFKASGGGVDMYVTTGGLSYVFTHTQVFKKPGRHPEMGDTKDSVIQQYCRGDMELVGADIRQENIVKEGESKDYNNYYIGNITALNVRYYEKVTIKNVYPGIDWVLYTAKGADNITTGRKGLQYDFVVHPGADASLIRLRYKGTDQPQMENDGSMKISLPVGYIKDGTPLSHAADGYDVIQTNYTLLPDKEVGFALDNYNKNETVVIDPPLLWSTYVGGSGTDQFFSVWSDGSSVFVFGNTTSSNFPATNPNSYPTYQGTLGAGTNLVILKFSTSGVPLWITYYGGSTSGESDNATSISGDANNIWLDGNENTANTNFPTTNPNGYSFYQSVNTMSFNPPAGTSYTTVHIAAVTSEGAFVGEFSKSNGQVQYMTYLNGGGGSDDQSRSLYDDGTHVWYGGYATSTSCPGVYQSSFYHAEGFGGSQNVDFGEFNAVANIAGQTDENAGDLIWKVNGSAYANVQSIYSNGTYLFMGGLNTNAVAISNFPSPATEPAGSWSQSSPESTGNISGWIVQMQISTGNQPVWSSCVAGNESGGIFQNKTEDVNGIWANGTDFWISGYTGSTDLATTMPHATGPLLVNTTGGFFRSAYTTSTGSRAWIAEFNESTDAPVWGTYFGGTTTSESDGVGGVLGDTKGNIWFYGMTSSSAANFPLTNPGGSGYYKTTLGSGVAWNDFVAEFNSSGVLEYSTYFGGTASGESTQVGDGGQGCGPSIAPTNNAVYVIGVSTGSSYATGFPSATPSGAYTQPSETGQDGFIAEFSLFSVSVTSATGVTCKGTSTGSATAAPIGGTPPYTYSWNTSPAQLTETATGLSAGTYTVTAMDNSGASGVASVTITQPAYAIRDSVVALSVVNLTCYGVNTGSGTIGAKYATGQTGTWVYTWSPVDNSSAFTGTASGLSAGTYTVTVVDSLGCTATNTGTITQPAAITVTVTATPVVCYGAVGGTATASVTNGVAPYTYSWSNGSSTVSTAMEATGLSAGSYTVTVTDNSGCNVMGTTVVLPATMVDVALTSISYPTCPTGTGSATVSAAGGTQPYTYSWSPNSNSTDMATGLGVGTYTVNVQDVNGCTGTVGVTMP